MGQNMWLDEVFDVEDAVPGGTDILPLSDNLGPPQQSPPAGQQPLSVFQPSPSSMQSGFVKQQQQQQPVGYSITQGFFHQQMPQQQTYGPASMPVPNDQYNVPMPGPPLGYDVLQGSTDMGIPSPELHAMAQASMMSPFPEPLSPGGPYMSPNMPQQNMLLPTQGQGPYIPALQQQRVAWSMALGHLVVLPEPGPDGKIKQGYYTVDGQRHAGLLPDGQYAHLHYYNGHNAAILPRTTEEPATLAEMLRVDWRPSGDFYIDQVRRDVVHGHLLKKARSAKERAQKKARKAAEAAAVKASSFSSSSSSGSGSGSGFEHGFGVELGFGLEPGFGYVPPPTPPPPRQRQRQRQLAPRRRGAALIRPQAYYPYPLPVQ